MKQHKLKYPVEKMCKLLNVSCSGYYHWLENEDIVSVIKEIFEESHQSYSAPRMAVELEKRGFKVSRPQTGRMIKAIILHLIQSSFKQRLISLAKIWFDICPASSTNSPFSHLIISVLCFNDCLSR